MSLVFLIALIYRSISVFAAVVCVSFTRVYPTGENVQAFQGVILGFVFSLVKKNCCGLAVMILLRLVVTEIIIETSILLNDFVLVK